MNRRTFLCGLGKFLGAATVTAVAPKFIFDCGKNLWKPQVLMGADLGWNALISSDIHWVSYEPTYTYYLATGIIYPTTAQYKLIGKEVQFKLEAKAA